MNPTTTEDRVWAVLSHLSSLAFGIGIFLPVVGWTDQRRRSNYAAFQCLQALGYQSLGYTVWILSYLVALVIVLIILVRSSFQAASAGQSFNPFVGPGAILFFAVVFGFLVLYFLLPISAAVACAFGKDFRYPIMGNRLARYLEYDPMQTPESQAWLHEDHELRWVAAMGHFSILIALWGMLAPLTAWILYGKRSLFLQFQSIQTLIYQGFVTVLYFVGGFIYLFGFLLLFAINGWNGASDLNSSQGVFSMVVFGVSSLVSLLLLLIVPFLHILGQWAGYRVLKGDNYRYPFIGIWVERLISNRTHTTEESDLSLKGTSS